MKIAAFDLSLTSTGYAVGQSRPLSPDVSSGYHETGKLRGFERIEAVRYHVVELAHGADLVVLEGYSFGSRGRALFDLAELGGVVRMALRDLGYSWVDVAPGTLKKYATGKGSAKKELMLVEAVKRLGYQGSNTDEVDALWLLEMAMDHYAFEDPRVPKSHRAALEVVEWPVQ